MGKQRSASEVLIDIENKLTELLNLEKSRDLQFNILNNKINLLMQTVQGQGASFNFKSTPTFVPPTNSKFKVEATDLDPKNVLIQKDKSQSVNLPTGDRRISKTVSPQTAPLPQGIPQGEFKEFTGTEVKGDKVTVSQRVLFKNKKAVALAHVEIFSGNNVIYSDSTNMVGKWNVPLSLGEYKLVVKRKTATGDFIAEEKLIIDGKNNPLVLEDLILK